MKNALQEYFYYTRLERNGLLILGSLSLFFLILPHFILPLVAPQQMDFSAFQSEIIAFQPTFQAKKNQQNRAALTSVEAENSTKKLTMFHFDPNTATIDVFIKLGLSEKVAGNIINYREKVSPFSQVEDLKKVYTLKETDYERLKNYVHLANLPKTALKFDEDQGKTTTELQLFPFNPNTISESELVQLGLSDRVIKTILNFRNKGGTFRKPEDLNKIYGLTTSVFQQLKPYIQLTIANNAPKPTFTLQESEVPSAYSNPVALTIDINQATVEEWQSLKGIGPYYSKKIVWYREKLGGFASIEQVGETNQLPDSTFQKIRPFLKQSPVVKKIAINTEEEKMLAKHPYLSYALAKAIINYREQHGAFENIEDFKKMRILKDHDVERLSPYLSF